MEQFSLCGHWSSFIMSENGYPTVVYECSVCHKFTYKGKCIVFPFDYCPNCRSQMFDDDEEEYYYEEGLI
jgi:hypothetical protein